MLVASLLMYDRPDVVQRANDALWAALRDRLRARGLDVPETLDRSGSHDSYWLRPDLIFGQTCGYPYVEELKGRVRLVAAPAFRYWMSSELCSVRHLCAAPHSVGMIFRAGRLGHLLISAFARLQGNDRRGEILRRREAG